VNGYERMTERVEAPDFDDVALLMDTEAWQ
jgi:hypothetical protein